MCYNYFTMETRVSLKNLLQIKSQKGLTYRAIGNLLKMSHSTVIREVNSNGGIELYDPHLANRKSTKNKGGRGRKCKITEQIKSIVEDKLKLSWSPEQLINREKLKISTKSVYNYINSGLIDSNDKKNLRFKGKRRNKNEKRGKFNGKKSISERSQEANERKEFGHYEIDTVYSSRASKACLVTINERVSRKYWVVKIDNRQASSVKEAVNNILNTELSELVKTITADRGKEFALIMKLKIYMKSNFIFVIRIHHGKEGQMSN